MTSGYGHFTTRQNVQFNWIKLRDMPDDPRRAGDVEMHAIQTRGNCIRNVTSDQFAGAADEIEDPRPVARSSGNGRPCIRNSRPCRASSRSR
jgi:sulfite reductase (NADPH) hemoprotein beta-component